MYQHRRGARFEYRQLERVEEAVSLAGKFPRLKSLLVDFTYCRPADVLKLKQL